MRRYFADKLETIDNLNLILKLQSGQVSQAEKSRKFAPVPALYFRWSCESKPKKLSSLVLVQLFFRRFGNSTITTVHSPSFWMTCSM